MKKALVFYGGWEGHEPKKVAERFASMLEKNGFAVDLFEGMSVLDDKDKLLSYDLIVPCVTMGNITPAQESNISDAVASGIGLCGCHGGMCDSFRQATTWQFMTGGQWVSHPGNDGVEYTVNIVKNSSPIVEGIEDFKVVSEHYYLHIDPAVEVLATTRFPLAPDRHMRNKPVDMPVVWTKYWGDGRVFYCSLGHHADNFDLFPSFALIMERGMLWAAKN